MSICQSCTMPSVEGFTQQQESKGGAYACLSQTSQQCAYTAQGELVCGQQKSMCGGDVKNGFSFMERFEEEQEQTVEGFKSRVAASMTTRRKK